MDINFENLEFSEYLLKSTKNSRLKFYKQIVPQKFFKRAIHQLSVKTQVKLTRITRKEIEIHVSKNKKTTINNIKPNRSKSKLLPEFNCNESNKNILNTIYHNEDKEKSNKETIKSKKNLIPFRKLKHVDLFGECDRLIVHPKFRKKSFENRKSEQILNSSEKYRNDVIKPDENFNLHNNTFPKKNNCDSIEKTANHDILNSSTETVIIGDENSVEPKDKKNNNVMCISNKINKSCDLTSNEVLLKPKKIPVRRKSLYHESDISCTHEDAAKSLKIRRFSLNDNETYLKFSSHKNDPNIEVYETSKILPPIKKDQESPYIQFGDLLKDFKPKKSIKKHVDFVTPMELRKQSFSFSEVPEEETTILQEDMQTDKNISFQNLIYLKSADLSTQQKCDKPETLDKISKLNCIENVKEIVINNKIESISTATSKHKSNENSVCDIKSSKKSTVIEVLRENVAKSPRIDNSPIKTKTLAEENQIKRPVCKDPNTSSELKLIIKSARRNSEVIREDKETRIALPSPNKKEEEDKFETTLQHKSNDSLSKKNVDKVIEINHNTSEPLSIPVKIKLNQIDIDKMFPSTDSIEKNYMTLEVTNDDSNQNSMIMNNPKQDLLKNIFLRKVNVNTSIKNVVNTEIILEENTKRVSIDSAIDLEYNETEKKSDESIPNGRVENINKENLDKISTEEEIMKHIDDLLLSFEKNSNENYTISYLFDTEKAADYISEDLVSIFSVYNEYNKSTKGAIKPENKIKKFDIEYYNKKRVSHMVDLCNKLNNSKILNFNMKLFFDTLIQIVKSRIIVKEPIEEKSVIEFVKHVLFIISENFSGTDDSEACFNHIIVASSIGYLSEKIFCFRKISIDQNLFDSINAFSVKLDLSLVEKSVQNEKNNTSINKTNAVGKSLPIIDISEDLIDSSNTKPSVVLPNSKNNAILKPFQRKSVISNRYVATSTSSVPFTRANVITSHVTERSINPLLVPNITTKSITTPTVNSPTSPVTIPATTTKKESQIHEKSLQLRKRSISKEVQLDFLKNIDQNKSYLMNNVITPKSGENDPNSTIPQVNRTSTTSFEITFEDINTLLLNNNDARINSSYKKQPSINIIDNIILTPCVSQEPVIEQPRYNLKVVDESKLKESSINKQIPQIILEPANNNNNTIYVSEANIDSTNTISIPCQLNNLNEELPVESVMNTCPIGIQNNSNLNPGTSTQLVTYPHLEYNKHIPYHNNIDLNKMNYCTENQQNMNQSKINIMQQNLLHSNAYTVDQYQSNTNQNNPQLNSTSTNLYQLLTTNNINYPVATQTNNIKLPVATQSNNIKLPLATQSNNINFPVATQSNNINSPVATQANNINSPVVTQSNNISSPVATQANNINSPVVTQSNNINSSVATHIRPSTYEYSAPNGILHYSVHPNQNSSLQNMQYYQSETINYPSQQHIPAIDEMRKFVNSNIEQLQPVRGNGYASSLFQPATVEYPMNQILMKQIIEKNKYISQNRNGMQGYVPNMVVPRPPSYSEYLAMNRYLQQSIFQNDIMNKIGSRQHSQTQAATAPRKVIQNNHTQHPNTQISTTMIRKNIKKLHSQQLMDQKQIMNYNASHQQINSQTLSAVTPQKVVQNLQYQNMNTISHKQLNIQTSSAISPRKVVQNHHTLQPIAPKQTRNKKGSSQINSQTLAATIPRNATQNIHPQQITLNELYNKRLELPNNNPSTPHEFNNMGSTRITTWVPPNPQLPSIANQEYFLTHLQSNNHSITSLGSNEQIATNKTNNVHVTNWEVPHRNNYISDTTCEVPKKNGQINQLLADHNTVSTSRNASRDSGYTSPITQQITENQMLLHLCDYCHKSADLVCSGCNAVYYCSETCQRKAWTRHEIICSKK